MQSYTRHRILHWNPQGFHPVDGHLVAEEPLSIRVDGKPYAVVMRTPGEEKAHVAGFALAEGIIDTLDDLVSIAVCDEGGDTNVATVTLTAARRKAVAATLERRGFISQTSCGICGREIVEDLARKIAPLPDCAPLDSARLLHGLETLSELQPLRRRTRASHAAALLDDRLQRLAGAEDVGRHNALDKAVGALLLSGRLSRARVGLLSSRTSYELVQKTARARVPIVLSVSRPTHLAVTLAHSLNITLACLARNEGLYIFCGAHRLQ